MLLLGWWRWRRWWWLLSGPKLYATLSGLPFRFGDKLLKNQVACPQNVTAVLQGLCGVRVSLSDALFCFSIA